MSSWPIIGDHPDIAVPHSWLGALGPKLRVGLIVRSLARNTFYVLSGQLIPQVVALVSIPIAARLLGVREFGVLAFAWVVIGFLAYVDLGLGRAASRHAAGASSGTPLGALVVTTYRLATALGAALGALSYAIILLGETLLPGKFGGEFGTVLILLTVLVPVTVVSAATRGILEGLQSFRFVNSVVAAGGILMYLIPAICALYRIDIVAIVTLLVATRLAMLLAYLARLSAHVRVQKEAATPRFSVSIAALIAQSGGWMGVSSIASPLFVYADRLIVGFYLGAAPLAYYSSAFELAVRPATLPSSMVVALFPALTRSASQDGRSFRALYVRAFRYQVVAVGLIGIAVELFGGEVLRALFGREYSDAGTVPLLLLALGISGNVLAQVPFTAIQALGRPVLTARLHILELPIFLGVAWLSITTFGIVGGALSWLLRAYVDGALLFLLASSLQPLRNAVSLRLAASALLVLGLQIAALTIGITPAPLIARVAAFGILAVTLGSFSWKYLLERPDRVLLSSLVQRIRIQQNV